MMMKVYCIITASTFMSLHHLGMFTSRHTAPSGDTAGLYPTFSQMQSCSPAPGHAHSGGTSEKFPFKTQSEAWIWFKDVAESWEAASHLSTKQLPQWLAGQDLLSGRRKVSFSVSSQWLQRPLDLTENQKPRRHSYGRWRTMFCKFIWRMLMRWSTLIGSLMNPSG